MYYCNGTSTYSSIQKFFLKALIDPDEICLFVLIGGGGSSVVVDPREIRITETSPDGDTGHAGLPPDSMFNVDMGGAAPSGVPPRYGH